ncbi:ABC transporter substrate-binding protein [Galbitalea sp. SE-J8]|uniref:ABC transporter substrate-binding protein n=1 Tax=Galbitalea sp. SE-J8 TaxID=3054952 RepID=UPI00259CD25E|nr:ABC transporter substrate-binding protein [Galbitalea sp. SE-J8]MDM4761666.1 ABC transporter substrate-binding protein [Galbitalea sp. SE-J8]
MNHTIRPRLRVLAAAALAAGLAAGALSSCSSGSAGDSGGTTTITFWNGFTGPDGDVLKARVAAFNASQKKVQVKMSVMPWDVLGEKLLPALGAHKGPSIAVGGAESVGQYASKGAFADLSDYYKGWKDASQLFPADRSATEFEGKNYAVPMTFTPVLVYYSKKLFTEAGLDPNKPPTTWQEFQDDAVKLTKDVDGDGKPDQYGFVLPDHTSPAIWESLMWGNGGGTLSEDGRKSTIQDAASIEAVTTWADLLKSKKVSPAGISGPDADALFQSGKVGMLSEGPWMINGFKGANLDFGITNVPEGPKGAIPVANSNMLFVSKDAWGSADQKSAVTTFLNYWNSKENQLAWSTGSGNPPTRQDISVDDVKAKAPEMAQFMPFRDKARFFLAGTTDFGDINSSVYEASMQKITAGKGEPQEVMTQAGQQLKTILAGSK